MAIYFDLCFYETIVKSFYHDIEHAGYSGELAIRQLYRFVLKNYYDGVVGPKKMAHDIAGTSLYEVGKLEPYLSIAKEASDLKWPDHHIEGNIDERFENLIYKIKDCISR